MASKLSQIKDQIVTSLETLTINSKTPNAIRGPQDKAKGAPLYDVSFASDSRFDSTESGVLTRIVDMSIWISGNVDDMSTSVDSILTLFQSQTSAPFVALRALDVGFVHMEPTAAGEFDGDDEGKVESHGMVRYDIWIRYTFS